MQPMLYLSEERVGELLRWPELIDTMERALADFSLGKVLQPVRNMLTIEEGKGYLGIMPAVAKAAMGAKLVSFYPGNAGTRVPTHLAMVLLFRSDTGEPLAVMDGRLITEMRTAAVSAAATRRLAGPASQILTLLGSGVQAAAHLQALGHLRSFEEIRVWSRTPEHAAHFAEQHNVMAMPSAEAAVRGADVVVTATAAVQPILKGGWLKPGAHVNAVGSPRPDWRELDDEAMRNTLIVDSRDAVLEESGDVILSGATIYAEIGEIFAGLKPTPAAATTIFKSVGIAIEDIAAAKLVYDAALRAERQRQPVPILR